MPTADANIAKEKESEEDEDETDEVSLCVNIGLRIIMDIILILQNELEYEAARLNFNLNSNIFWVFKGHMKWKLRISCYCSFLSKLKIQNDLEFFCFNFRMRMLINFRKKIYWEDMFSALNKFEHGMFLPSFLWLPWTVVFTWKQIFQVWLLLSECQGWLLYSCFAFRLSNERAKRIERYKTRLSLLLPPLVEQSQTDAHAGSWHNQHLYQWTLPMIGD